MKESRRQGHGRRVRRAAIAAPAILCVWVFFAQAAAAAAPQITKVRVLEAGDATAKLTAEVNPEGKPTLWHFEYGVADCAKSACISIPLPDGKLAAGGSPVTVEATLEDLAPGTLYHFLLSAKNNEGAVKSPDRVFATRSAPQGGLSDGRAYEQATPTDKDGGDALGQIGLIRATASGDGITFQSSFGIPGGKGAQSLPTYLALRGAGESGWTSRGLLPPPVFGERAQVQGWLSDFSETFTNASKLGTPRVKALVSQSPRGGEPEAITAYTAGAEYSFIGTDADASVVFFESQAQLPPREGESPIEEAVKGKSNVYAWDRATGRVSLAAVMNDGKTPPKGAFAGPFDWSLFGNGASALKQGGAARGYYLQSTHAITASGGLYFTEGGTGQLFLRLNPTRPQSEMVAGKCVKAEDACTIHVSASKRSVPDTAGTQPAAFHAATADGKEVLFTSPEKLTDDANTGPPQPAAAITQANSATGVTEDADFIPERAVGVAVDSKYIYWADPVGGTIGRAELDGKNVEKSFIEPGPTECEIEVEDESGDLIKETISAPSAPRWVAAGTGRVWWTTPGPLDNEEKPIDGCGAIGRAELDIDGDPVEVEPEFIKGALKPQGIAVDATHVYWANSTGFSSIGRATIEGKAVDQEFLDVPGEPIPVGLALDSSHVYFTLSGSNSYVSRIPLEEGPEEFIFIGKADLRGVTVDAGHVYWAFQGEKTIGRIALSDFPKSGGCDATPGCEKEFVKGIEGSLNGLAADGSHLYWSINGESPTNPGNDLYRYEPATDTLTDLTPLATGNGAEIQGLLGASADGSLIYLVANGDLDGAGGAEQGDCHRAQPTSSLSTVSGSCTLYLLEEGKAPRFLGRLDGRDSLAWTGSAAGVFSGAGYIFKSSFLSEDARTLLFLSRKKLTTYDNEGVAQLYRWSGEEEALSCVSCPPSGKAPGNGPSLGSVGFPGLLSPPLGSVGVTESNILSADGKRVFFESAEALLPVDVNGDVKCLSAGSASIPSCLDVYEWEAPGSGTCTEGAPGWSPLNQGCIYLISTGKSSFPSILADASETGDDVFFFTREGLVGQDQDELQDVYDARVGGGLASQSRPPAVPCSSTEACHGPVSPAPVESTPGSETFVGPGNQAQKHKPNKGKKSKGKKKKSKGKKRRAKAKERAGR